MKDIHLFLKVSIFTVFLFSTCNDTKLREYSDKLEGGMDGCGNNK